MNTSVLILLGFRDRHDRRALTWCASRVTWALVCIVVALVSGAQTAQLSAKEKYEPATAQQAAAARKLPSAEKVVDGYLKAVGGKKRLSAIRDATYEWTIQLKDQHVGLGKTFVRSPSSVRTEMVFGNGELTAGANGRSAWKRGLAGELQTLTDAEAAAAKLQAVLDAGRLVEIKKSNVLARVLSIKSVGNEPAYVVEVAACLAGLRGMTTEEMGKLTTENFSRIFQLESRE